MRTLYLLRHGKAEAGEPGGRDFDRALAPRGLRDSARMGAHLAERPEPPRFYLCSPARRAVQTLDGVRKSLPLGKRGEFHENLYLASAEQIFERVCEVDDAFEALLASAGFETLDHVTEVDLTERYFRDREDGLAPGVPIRVIIAERSRHDAATRRGESCS